MTFEAQQSIGQASDGDMVTGDVRIIELKGHKAFVQSDMPGTCGGCAVAKGCSTKVLSELFSGGLAPLAIENDFGGVVGERIRIGIASTTILKISAVTYLIPLIGLLCGAVLGSTLQAANIVSPVLAVLGLFLGFCFARSYYVSERVAASITPILLKKLS